MKILELIIKDNLGVEIRKINFEKNGLFFVFGDIQKRNETTKSSNSLGKTILLKCINYIFGGNDDNGLKKDKVRNYSIEAIVNKNEKNYKIIRKFSKLNDKDIISIDGKNYSLDEYKTYFSIDRKLYNPQILLERKKDLKLTYGGNSNGVIPYIKLLNFNDLVPVVEETFNLKDNVALFKKYKKQYLPELNKKKNDLQEKIFFTKGKIYKLEKELEEFKKRISKIKTSEIKKEIIEEYNTKNVDFKYKTNLYEQKRNECHRLERFIEESNKNDVSSSDIEKIYAKVNIEIPELVKKNLNDVEEFFKKVYEDRKNTLSNKKGTIENEMNKLKIEIEEYSIELDKLGELISESEVYKETIELYENKKDELTKLKYEEGTLDEAEKMSNQVENDEKTIRDNFEKIRKTLDSYKTLIEKYRNFLNNIIQRLYDGEISLYFDIVRKGVKVDSIPVDLKMSLSKDDGEGVNEVKKNLLDYLIFKYNNYIEILIQDSSCYEGIDPRQISKMFCELEKIAEETNKQVIISINKYQLGDYEETINFVKNKSVIILSENEKLLKMDFS
jgi:uncharacterized protein YydD (DUF2326 family)